MQFLLVTPGEVLSVGPVFPFVCITLIGSRVDPLFKTFQFWDSNMRIKVIDSWIVISWVDLAM